MHLKSTDSAGSGATLNAGEGDIIINPIRAYQVQRNLSRSLPGIAEDDRRCIADILEKMTHSDTPVKDESGSESKDSSRGR